MRTENVSLPYPVLGISDDIRPTLEETGCSDPSIKLTEEGSSFRISVTLNLDNSDILNYIQDGSAEYTVEVSCKTTMFRKSITSSIPSFTFLIEKKLLNGKLEFECYVIVKKDIFDYKNAGLNSDYEGHVINLHKGDLLVVYRKSSIPLDLDLRNIRNMKSFMTVKLNPNPKVRSVTFDLDNKSDGKILILLPEAMMAEYNKKPPRERESVSEESERRKILLKASLFLNALIYALMHYQKYKEKDYLWVNALTYRLNLSDLREKNDELFNNNTESFDLDSLNEIIDLAQILLNQPYLSMLKEISYKGNIVKSIFDDDHYGK